MIEVDQSQFDNEVVQASFEQLVLVDFWAPWCGPCRALGPILEQAEARSAGTFKLVKINSDENQALSEQYGVRSIPFVLAFQNGEPVDQFVGALTASQVDAFIDNLLPKPGAEHVINGRAALAAAQFEQAADELSIACDLDDSDPTVRADLARALWHTASPHASEVIEPIRKLAVADKHIATVVLLIDEFDTDTTTPPTESLTTPEQAVHRAGEALRAAQWETAMIEALEVVRLDKKHRQEIGRRLLLAAFEFCPDRALIAGYRRKLAAALN